MKVYLRPLSLNAKSIWCQTSFIWSFKQGTQNYLVRCRFIPRGVSTWNREFNKAMAVKASLKMWIRVLAIFIAIIPTRLPSQMKANSPEVDGMLSLPAANELWYIRGMHGQSYQDLLVFAPFPPLGELLSFSSVASSAFSVFGGLRHWCVVPDTEFGAYNRKICLPKLPKQFCFKH